jgi:DNA-binding NarL/FixJ family response regulator
MSTTPRLLLVLPPKAPGKRWAALLSGIGNVGVAQTIDEARALCTEGEPDVCIVDVDLSLADGTPLVIALRGLCTAAEFIALAGSADSTRLIQSVNDGNVRRFLSYDNGDDEVLTRVQQVVQAQRSLRGMRTQLRALSQERERLASERERLVRDLATSSSQVAAAIEEQQSMRDKLQSLMHVSVPHGNVVSFDDFKVRVGGEVERHSRYAHPVSLLRFSIDYKGAPSQRAREMSEEVLGALARTVRHIDLLGPKTPTEVWVLLPVTERANAERAVQRLTRAIDTLAFPVAIEKVAVFAYPDDASAFDLR